MVPIFIVLYEGPHPQIICFQKVHLKIQHVFEFKKVLPVGLIHL